MMPGMGGAWVGGVPDNNGCHFMNGHGWSAPGGGGSEGSGVGGGQWQMQPHVLGAGSAYMPMHFAMAGRSDAPGGVTMPQQGQVGTMPTVRAMPQMGWGAMEVD